MRITERKQRLKEIQADPNREKKQRIIKDSVTATSTEELRQAGFSHRQIYDLCLQVSRSIDDYNNDHPAEMLPKSPDVILSQLDAGLTVLIASSENGRPIYLYHGTSYEIFGDDEDQLLQTQILEFGSAIANADFRAGYGLGTMGAQARVGLLNRYKRMGLNAFGLSTIKRMITGRVWSKVGAEAISFWDVPYLSYLTDTCEGSSERYGHQSCQFRRSIDKSNPGDLRAAVGKSTQNGYLPCTLIVTDRNSAYKFDEEARRMHDRMTGVAIPRGEISVEAYEQIAQFFESLKNQGNTR